MDIFFFYMVALVVSLLYSSRMITKAIDAHTEMLDRKWRFVIKKDDTHGH